MIIMEISKRVFFITSDMPDKALRCRDVTLRGQCHVANTQSSLTMQEPSRANLGPVGPPFRLTLRIVSLVHSFPRLSRFCSSIRSPFQSIDFPFLFFFFLIFFSSSFTFSSKFSSIFSLFIIFILSSSFPPFHIYFSLFVLFSPSFLGFLNLIFLHFLLSSFLLFFSWFLLKLFSPSFSSCNSSSGSFFWPNPFQIISHQVVESLGHKICYFLEEIKPHVLFRFEKKMFCEVMSKLMLTFF